MKRILTAAAAMVFTALIALPQPAESKLIFPLSATLEYCAYGLPCGTFAAVTMHKEPAWIWEADGITYGTWEIRHGPQTELRLNFYPPYDTLWYRLFPDGTGCATGGLEGFVFDCYTCEAQLCPL